MKNVSKLKQTVGAKREGQMDAKLRKSLTLRTGRILGRGAIVDLAAAAYVAVAGWTFCGRVLGASRTLTFSDCPYAVTALPANYGSDKEISLTWISEGMASSLVKSTGEGPFLDHSADGTNRFIFAQGTTVIEFNPTVRLNRVFVRDNEPDFLQNSACGLTVRGELEGSLVFTRTVDFVPKSQSGVWIEVTGEGAIDTLRLISLDDLTKSYLVDDMELEIYSETKVIALAGLNRAVAEGSIVTLDGRESLNADSFRWVQVRVGSEPEVVLSSAGGPVATFVAPDVGTATVLTFELTASGPLGSDTDRVEITINISTAPGSAPDRLTVLPSEEVGSWMLGAVVEWAAHPDAKEYAVYRAEGSPENDYVKVAPSTGLTSYRDDWLEEGEIYFYKVGAANEFGPGPVSGEVGFVACRNLAFDADGVAVAKVMKPTGTGLKDIEAIRNGETEESYDSYHGFVKESEDWYGYLWGGARYFDTVVYYEGKNFYDGGWWTNLAVEYTEDGINWRQARGLSISPVYNFLDVQEGRVEYSRFHLRFERRLGRGIRIHGEPGGIWDFTSIAELEVYGDQEPNIVIADAGPDLREDEGVPVMLHGENSRNVEGYFWEQVKLGGEPEVVLNWADTANPTFIVEDVPRNTLFCFRLTVTGLHGPRSDQVYVTVMNKEPPRATTGLSATGGDRRVELSWDFNDEATSYKLLRSTSPVGSGIVIAENITTTSYVDKDSGLKPYYTYYYQVLGVNEHGEGPGSNVAAATPIENFAVYGDAVPIARVTRPTGSGQKDLNVIRNGIYAEKGYDSYDGPNPAEEDWYGYLWSEPIYPERVVYTMGRNFLDGGWWTSLTVQYTSDGVSWITAPNVTITPPYNFKDDPAARPDYSSYTLSFDRVQALGVRIYGSPGGLVDFTSIVELEVYGLDAPVACKREILEPFYLPGGVARVSLSVEIHEPPAPESLTITEVIPQGAVLVEAGGGTVGPEGIRWDFGAGEVGEMNLSYTIVAERDFSGRLSFEGWLCYGTVSDQRIRGELSLYAKPAAPMNLRLEMGLVGHLRWSPVLQEGITGYHVYRSVNGGNYEDISGLIGDASFDDLNVERGMSCEYKVSAESVSGAESELAESERAGPASIVMERREFEEYDAHEPVGIVDIREFGDGGRFVAGVTEGERWGFSFEVAEPGYIKMADLRAASSQEATYEFLWDHSRIGRFSFNTGGETNWRIYQMDIPAFLSSAGTHTLTIAVARGKSNADFLGVGFGWSAPARELIFEESFDGYSTTEEVETLGKWSIISGGERTGGSWRLWNTGGEPLAQGEPGPDFPGFSSGYMVSNGEWAGSSRLDEQLISPEIDCTRYRCVAVEFLSAINVYEQDTEGDLQTTDLDISFYGERSQSWSEWVNLFRRDRNGGDAFSAIPRWFDASSLADGKKVKFRWRFYNTRNDYWWAIEEVKVSGEKRPPRIVRAAATPEGAVVLTWEDFGQGLYTVECCDDLVGGLWQPVPGTSWPAAETTWQGDAVAVENRRFYRVRCE